MRAPSANRFSRAASSPARAARAVARDVTSGAVPTDVSDVSRQQRRANRLARHSHPSHLRLLPAPGPNSPRTSHPPSPPLLPPPFLPPQVKCGVCAELLLRGQKDEHEKICVGKAAMCRPVAPGAPGAAAAAARAAAQAKLAGLGAGTRVPAHLRAPPRANPAAAKHGKEWADHVPPTKENVGPNHLAARKPPAPGIPNRGAGAALKKAAASSKASHPPSSRAGPQGPSAADALDDSDAGLDLKDRLKKHEGMATMKPNPNKVYVGDRAEVAGRKGSVMFVGPAEFAGGGIVVGLRLDEKRTTSECDGKYDGERLFRCKPGFGIFVPVEDVKKIDEVEDEDDLWDGLAGAPPSESGDERKPREGGGGDPVDALDNVVGQTAAKAKIQAMVNALQVNRRRVAAGGRAEPAPHVVLAGAAGSGKSTLARLVARIVSECDVSRHGPLVRPSRADLVAMGRSPGRTAELIAQQCEKAEGGVLLIDDFHRMLPIADAGNVRDTPGMEAMEALAAEVERRARKAGKGIVLVLAGEADGIAAARRLCPPLDAVLPAPVLLPDFTPLEVVQLLDRMASDRGFSLARGLREDKRLEAHVAEAARCADPTRRNAHLARALLEAAINAQTERVFSLGTIGKDTLTVLTCADFVGRDAAEGGASDGAAAEGGDARRMRDDTEKALADLEKVVGLDGVKDFIKSLRAQLLVEKERVAAGLPSAGGGVLHMVFAGNPGTGKTTVARIVANLLRALGVLRRGHLVEADRSSLVAGYSGQTALKTKAVVQEALGGVLFVDEAYALVSGDRDSFGKEALDTLMKEMEDHREDLVVIAAGYIVEMKDLLAANPGMESRFPTTLHFADYTAPELMKIAEAALEPQKMKLGEGAAELLATHFETEIATRAPEQKGSNGRGVRNLLEAAKRAQALRLAEVKAPKTLDDLTTLTAADCAAACGVPAPAAAKKKGAFW